MESGPEKFGYETSMWTMPLANMHIKRKFDVDYEVHSVWELIRMLGFRLVKPRPKLQNSATQKEIDTFKKKSSQAGKKVDQNGIRRIDGQTRPTSCLDPCPDGAGFEQKSRSSGWEA